MASISEKLFLDQSGVSALVSQISSMYKALDQQDAEFAASLAHLVERMDEVFGDDEGEVDSHGHAEISLDEIRSKSANALNLVLGFADEIRAELGTKGVTANEDGTYVDTIYGKLQELADLITANQEAIAKNAADILEMQNLAITDVTSEYSDNKQVVTLNFLNKAAESRTTFTLDLSDFAIDGMIHDAKLIDTTFNNTDLQAFGTSDAVLAALAEGTVVDGEIVMVSGTAYVACYLNEGEVAELHKLTNTTIQSPGKYLMFCFNRSSNGADAETATGGSEVAEVFVPVEDLFTDYSFDVESKNSDYVEIAVEQSRTNADSLVKTTVSLGSVAVADFNLVEGKAVDAEGKTIRGIESLHSDLAVAEADIDQAEADIDALEADLAETKERVTKNEEDIVVINSKIGPDPSAITVTEVEDADYISFSAMTTVDGVETVVGSDVINGRLACLEAAVKKLSEMAINPSDVTDLFNTLVYGSKPREYEFSGVPFVLVGTTTTDGVNTEYKEQKSNTAADGTVIYKYILSSTGEYYVLNGNYSEV